LGGSEREKKEERGAEKDSGKKRVEWKTRRKKKDPLSDTYRNAEGATNTQKEQINKYRKRKKKENTHEKKKRARYKINGKEKKWK
jgi:hypothetical protein